MRTLSSRFSGVTVVAAACAASLATMGCGKLRPKHDDAPPAAALAPQEAPEQPVAPAPDKPAPAPSAATAVGAPAAAPAPSDDATAGADDDSAPAKGSRGARASKRGHGSHRRSRDGAKGHAAEPASGAQAAAGDDPYEDAAPLRVVRFVVAKGVSGREPVGAGATFHADGLEKIYAFVELANDSKVEGEVEVVFTPTAGGASHRVKLDVGPQARWRTWATSRKARGTGAWTATVRAADGSVLASTKFEIAP